MHDGFRHTRPKYIRSQAAEWDTWRGSRECFVIQIEVEQVFACVVEHRVPESRLFV